MRVVVITLLSAFILFGLYILGLGLRNVYRAVASQRWPRVPGAVVESATSASVSTDRETRIKSTTYQAQIVFAYQVNGKSYTTDTLHFGQTLGSSDASEAELLHRRYPVGGPVSVSYDPGEPSIAAVKPGVDPDVFWLPGAGLAFVLPCVIGLVFFLTLEMEAPGFAVGLSLFAIVFCLAGAAMLYAGGVRLWNAGRSRSWPVARGVIVFQHRGENDSLTRDSDGTAQHVTSYSTNLLFQYQVGGVAHFANTRRFGQLAGAGENWADEIARLYPEGAQVKVAYCPSDPDLAVLEPGVTSEACWLPGAGLAFLLFGLAALKWAVPALSS
jgi:hypothetical protein